MWPPGSWVRKVMFNMDAFEMIVIGVIALVVVGPKGLPEIGRMVGKWMRTFREAADEMKRGLYFEDDYRPSSPRRIPTSPTTEPKKEISRAEITEAVMASESKPDTGESGSPSSGGSSDPQPAPPPDSQDPPD